MLAAIASLTALGLTLGTILGMAAKKFKVETNPLINEVNEMLPGTQCGQCGFTGCNQAAEAIVEGEAPVTVCPPGGKSLAEELAQKLGVTVDLSNMKEEEPIFAKVREATCIGCTRCYKVCPTDAIVGAPKQIHAVIRDACTGCKACIDVCPTECLVAIPIQKTLQTWHWPKPAMAA
ncbi:RnfABCDGE type electron transport complex subunit B [Kaarinaea lacus]